MAEVQAEPVDTAMCGRTAASRLSPFDALERDVEQVRHRARGIAVAQHAAERTQSPPQPLPAAAAMRSPSAAARPSPVRTPAPHADHLMRRHACPSADHAPARRRTAAVAAARPRLRGHDQGSDALWVRRPCAPTATARSMPQRVEIQRALADALRRVDVQPRRCRMPRANAAIAAMS